MYILQLKKLLYVGTDLCKFVPVRKQLLEVYSPSQRMSDAVT